MQAIDFWLWTIAATVASLVGLYFALRNLIRARIIEDTPTAKIRSAYQGYVELAGQAQLLDGVPIISPLTGSQCCWYRYTIEANESKDWRTVEHGLSDNLYLLRDETGECIIDPEGAEVSPTDRSVWYGHNQKPEERNPRRFRLNQGSGLKLIASPVRGRYRYTEECIYPGDRLYVIGLFKTLGDVEHQQERQQMVRERLAEWKQDAADLLARFDTNKDGEIDIEEWEQARTAAKTEVKHAHHEQLQKRVLNTMSQTGSSRHPYLLSSLPQFNLVRRYRLLAGGSVTGFFIAGSLATWMLVSRFMG